MKANRRTFFEKIQKRATICMVAQNRGRIFVQVDGYKNADCYIM